MMMQQINLYQPLFRKEKKVFSAQAMLEVTLAVLSLLFIYYALSAWNVSRLDEGVSLMDTGVKSQQYNLENLKKEFPQKVKDKLLAKRVKQLQLLVGKKQQILVVLTGGSGYGNQSGFSELLSGFARQQTEGVWLKKLEIDQGGLQLNIQGNAISADAVPKYIQGLSEDEIFKGRKFAVFQMAGKDKDDAHINFILSSQKAKQ